MNLIQIGAIMAISSLGAETVYIGTRTREGRSEGIYRMEFNPSTGMLSNVKLAAATVDPTFLAVHPTRPLLFAVQASPEGMLRSFAIEPGGGLKLLNAVSSRGDGPAHVQIDRTGHWVATANYNSGSMAVYRIESDGRLSEAADWRQHEGKSVHARQAGPHAHSVNFSADNRHLYVADLGLDEVKVYGFDARTGKLTGEPALMTPKAAGPRHLALGHNRVYVLNEIASSLSVFEKGKLLETVSTLPDGFQGESTAAEVVVHPNAKLLFASNRGADTIAVFKTGEHLTKIGDAKVGRNPRGFVLSPDDLHSVQGPCGPICFRNRGCRPRRPGSFAEVFCQSSPS